MTEHHYARWITTRIRSCIKNKEILAKKNILLLLESAVISIFHVDQSSGCLAQ